MREGYARDMPTVSMEVTWKKWVHSMPHLFGGKDVTRATKELAATANHCTTKNQLP